MSTPDSSPDDDLGLHLTMLDSDQLLRWAEMLEAGRPLSPESPARMREMAAAIRAEVREVLELRDRLRQRTLAVFP